MTEIRSLVDDLKTFVGYWSTPVTFELDGEPLELVQMDQIDIEGTYPAPVVFQLRRAPKDGEAMNEDEKTIADLTAKLEAAENTIARVDKFITQCDLIAELMASMGTTDAVEAAIRRNVRKILEASE